MGNVQNIPLPFTNSLTTPASKSVPTTDVYICNKSSFTLEMLDHCTKGPFQYINLESILPDKKYIKGKTDEPFYLTNSFSM
jgi:hypothetical protein